jgi:hypothetical protein
MSPVQLESIKIDNIVPSQAVNLGEELLVAGQSSDNATKDCSVSVIVNSIQPYQNADASGPEGISDFSQWKFKLDEQYTQLKEGSNKITAKLLCQSSPPRWYSVVVFGVPNPTYRRPYLLNLRNNNPTYRRPYLLNLRNNNPICMMQCLRNLLNKSCL